MLLLCFSNINTAILSSSNEANWANLMEARHFVVVLFSHAIIKDVNAWGVGTTHSSCSTSAASNNFFRSKFGPKQKLLDAEDVARDDCLGYRELSVGC